MYVHNCICVTCAQCIWKSDATLITFNVQDIPRNIWSILDEHCCSKLTPLWCTWHCQFTWLILRIDALQLCRVSKLIVAFMDIMSLNLTQGSHYILVVKFKDFSRTFKDVEVAFSRTNYWQKFTACTILQQYLMSICVITVQF